MSEFDLKHLKAAIHAAGTRVRNPHGDRKQAVSIAMNECCVPNSDERIVSELTAALAYFADAIRRAEKDDVPLPGIEIK